MPKTRAVSSQEDGILLGRTCSTHVLLAGRRRPMMAEILKGAGQSKRLGSGDSSLHGLLGFSMVCKTLDEMGSGAFQLTSCGILVNQVCLSAYLELLPGGSLKFMCTTTFRRTLVIPNYVLLAKMYYTAHTL